MPMRVASLASGSSGNSYYMECADGAIVVDAGLSGKKIEQGILAAGGNPARVQGVIITHDHADHVSGAGVLQRKFGWRLWMTRGTREAAAAALGRVDAEEIRPGSGLRAAGFDFEFYGTPHDGAEPILVAAERNGRRCGFFTDLGHVFAGLAERLDCLDFAFVESNYDPDLLRRSGYPPNVKRRIAGEHGHISNRECADLVSGIAGERLRSIVLSHLSKENNTPALARECFENTLALRMRETGMRVGVAPRHNAMLLCAV